MIEVTYDRQEHTVTARGHGGGKYGRDLVCAGVSTLMLTLQEVVESAGAVVEDAAVCLESGEGWISVSAAEEYDGLVTLMMDTVCKGFRWLSREYPDQVRYEYRK